MIFNELTMNDKADGITDEYADVSEGWGYEFQMLIEKTGRFDVENVDGEICVTDCTIEVDATDSVVVPMEVTFPIEWNYENSVSTSVFKGDITVGLARVEWVDGRRIAAFDLIDGCHPLH